jgi:hypothetical protein
MRSEMLALLTAFFLYHGDAGWAWWCLFVLVCFLYIVQEIDEARKKTAKEIEEQRIYWEGK